ncbi:MAG: molybdopterin-dependent oxidoreductase [Planctomycetaceae bacterium]
MNGQTRRSFLGAAATVAGIAGTGRVSAEVRQLSELPPELQAAVGRLEPWFTPQDKFQDVSRGRPVPHTLSPEQLAEARLTRDTWRLEILADPASPAKLGRQFLATDQTAIDFQTLLQLGEKHSVRFAKVMTCLNIGCPLGMGLWQGLPLRELLWMTQPTADFRRVIYYGFHNNDPTQMFRSSLPAGRILEDYDGLPPVLVCWKLNGHWLSPQRGGPVRLVVPEHYGFKSVKWLTTILLSNEAAANDTYISGNNDVDSPLKTFAATLEVPAKAQANNAIPVTGYAQVGIAGLAKVQVWVSRAEDSWPGEDPWFQTAPWQDATILPPPTDWGGDFAEGCDLRGVFGFTAAGQPQQWPLRLGKAHWCALLPPQTPGRCLLRCRTIDANGAAQPLPRPFRKSGRCDIEEVEFTVAEA